MNTPTARRQSAAFATVLLLAAVALAGCDGTARPDPSATQLPNGVSAVLIPSAAPDQAVVRVTNDTDQLLTIASLRVDDPRLAWAGWSRATGDRIVADRSTSLIPIRLPDVRCSTTAPKTSSTRVTVQYALGASIAVASAAITDPDGVITTLTSSRCG